MTGFARGLRLVSAAIGLLGMASASAGQDLAGAAAPRAAGTANTIVHRIGGFDFMPLGAAVPYILDFTNIGLTCTGTNCAFAAHPHLPTGALLTSLTLDYCIHSTGVTGTVNLQFLDCDTNGGNCSVLGNVSSDPGEGCRSNTVDLAAKAYTVQNDTRVLALISGVSNSASSALTGARIGYRLQISPPPLTATFADVPPNYIYFRAIEALAASGITSGCGGGNYCPEQPVTRGELAKFLANALGIHWPE